MVALNKRPLSGTSPHIPRSAGGTSRMFGRKRISKFRYRVLIIVYIALGCIIPVFVMKYTEEEQFYQQELWQQQEQRHQQDQGPQQHQQGRGPLLPNEGADYEQVEEGSFMVDESNPGAYRRRAFFQDLDNTHSFPPLALPSIYQQQWHGPDAHSTQSLLHGQSQYQYESQGSSPSSDPISVQINLFYEKQKARRKEMLANLTDTFALQRKKSSLAGIKSPQKYGILIQKVLQESRKMVHARMPEELLLFETSIPGTRLGTVAKTKRFRQLMDQTLNKGRWVYEPYRNYPDLGGAVGWNKKMKNERDRDVAIDRQPFPEAGKYHWEPIVDTTTNPSSPPSTRQEEANLEKGFGTKIAKGWHANRVQPEDFCSILGPRHIVLVGDLIHWQLHDSIMYSMFDTPQVCYGDVACHLGTGHPLCPLPNDVRLKFVRNDLLSPKWPHKSRFHEAEAQDPIEIPWLKDARNKGTVILGATHQTMSDKVFMRRLTDTMTKVRKARPDTLIIYRNNPVGHPDCPSKANGFNRERNKRPSRMFTVNTNKDRSTQRTRKKQNALAHNWTTFAAAAKPFEHDIPLAEILNYPLDWAHYDRQNQIAKKIVESAGGIYWNVATMTNMRPDGHVGGQDCLSYKRPGPTDEWAVSLYNLFKTIELVETEFN
ncbi:hypothetical protein BGZ65_002679 [Modicella reniformis]|uniref:Uncharacterized protein n=1 Tax=Modicella reniformis TaxID=1440133 RepID=A0A9P6SU01_9FUNG|nr:hypothetical protein BGZ65_002679 [Modicella reniformis]